MSLKLILGCMYSGKTTEILRRIFEEYQALSQVQKSQLEELLNLNDQEIFEFLLSSGVLLHCINNCGKQVLWFKK